MEATQKISNQVLQQLWKVEHIDKRVNFGQFGIQSPFIGVFAVHGTIFDSYCNIFPLLNSRL